MTKPSLPILAASAAVVLIAGYAIFFRPVHTLKEEASTNKEEVTAIIKEFINDNPDLIINSLQQAQTRRAKEDEAKAQQALGEKKNELEDRSISPIAGNPEGDVAIVEFFDYSCGYCKKVGPTINQLLNDDKNVAIILKEFPILGPNSEKASQVALAVYNIDKSKYFPFHNTLLDARDLNSEEAIIEKAVALGIDKEKLKEAMQKAEVKDELKRNRELAAQIGVNGTPAFIVNGELIPGAVDLATLKEKIAAARSKKGSDADKK